MRLALTLVAVLSLACLLPRAARVPLAGDYLDPVGHVVAQDETLNAASSLRMARQGDWLTPFFRGGPPPLLFWLSAASARAFGGSRLALRLPVALVCALAGCLVFLWAAEVRGWQAGACAAALLASNHLWHVFGGMVLADGLLAAFCAAAIFCLFTDPWLEQRATFWGFAGASAAAILTRSIAGMLPLAVLAAYWVAAPRKYRPRLARAALAACLALALAAPWFAWHLVTDHLGIPPPRTSTEGAALFYTMRAAVTDPILVSLALVSIPAVAAALRRREPTAVLLFCWLVVTAAAVLGWPHHNAACLLPMIPALVILVTAYTPFEGASAMFLPAVVALAFVVKIITAAAPWGLAFGGTMPPVPPFGITGLAMSPIPTVNPTRDRASETPHLLTIAAPCRHLPAAELRPLVYLLRKF